MEVDKDADVLNMSLDDIINKNKNKSKSGGASSDKDVSKSSRGRAGRPSGRRIGRAGGSDGGKRAIAKPSLDKLRVVVKNTGVSKPRGRGGRGQGAERLMPPRESKAPVDPEVLDGGARWEHDLFDDWEEPRRNLQQRLRGPADGFRLMVTNLADGVTDDDIKELFESCGKLKYAGIDWDRSGRSNGSAQVVFENKADAVKAKSTFDNVALDGQPMKIELFQSQPGERTLSSGLRVGALSRSQSGGRSNVAFTRSFQRAAGGIGGSRRPARGGGSGGRGRGRGGSRVVTQADLDKDLEAYMEE